MVRLKKNEDVVPVCPHCKAQLTTVYFQELAGLLGRRYIYFCPDCASCLGISHRKGLFMG